MWHVICILPKTRVHNIEVTRLDAR